MDAAAGMSWWAALRERAERHAVTCWAKVARIKVDEFFDTMERQRCRER